MTAHASVATYLTQEEDMRKQTRRMEMVWHPTPDMGDSDIWTVHFAQGNHSGLSYGWLPGFNWEWGGDDPIQVGGEKEIKEKIKKKGTEGMHRPAQHLGYIMRRDTLQNAPALCMHFLLK